MTEITANAQIIIHCPVSDAFEAFTDPHIMTQFWFPKASGRLEEGEQVKWYIGTDINAYEITVYVKTAQKPHTLQIQWGADGVFTEVEWNFESLDDGNTIVRICESGFSGDQHDVVRAALDSTGGFNQVITAAKALLEHGVRINVVKDHVSSASTVIL